VLRPSLHQDGRLVGGQRAVESERVLSRTNLVFFPRVVLHADIVTKKVEFRVALLHVPRYPTDCVSPIGEVQADMLHIRACPHDVIDNLE
jgi:hypothetical protein